MLLPVLQTLLVVIAGGLLFRLWRAATPDSRWLRIVVAAGFLARAVAGQVLFWISWGRLPVARSMQIGDGLWFFGTDAIVYLPFASAVARKGPWAIVTFDRTAPSVSFIQALGTSMMLFGGTTAVALLLNLFCYLGMIAILLHWSRNEPRTRVPVAVAVAGVSLSPAFMLWSLQPLKDSFFQFLVVAFVAACAAWQRAWVAERRHPATQAGVAALLFILLFVIAGIRWYFAFAMLIAASVFLLLTIFRTHGRRLAAAGTAIVVSLLLSRAFLFGGGPYIPPTISSALQASTALEAVRQLPSSVVGDVDRLRAGFERSGGNTSIQPGRRLSPPPAAAAKPATGPSRTAGAPAGTAARPSAPATAAPAGSKTAAPTAQAEVRAVLDAQVAAWNRGDLDRVRDFWRGSKLPESAAGTFSVEDVTIDISGANAVAKGRWSRVNDGEPRRGTFELTMRRSADGWKGTRYVSVPDAVAAAPPPTPAVVSEDDTIQKPTSRMGRLVSGAAAVVLPRAVGERLGLFHVGGGRGMFWFTELDTLVFDAVLLFAIAILLLHFSASLRNPLAWLVVLLTLLAGIPLVYTITNFGTLFRLREMIYLGVLLAPLAATTSAGSGKKHDAEAAS